MKKILRNFVLNIIVLKTVDFFIPNILFFSQGFKTVLLTALALTVFEYFIKPIAKLLFLPINILTLGLLRWVINVIGLYLVTMFVDGFSLRPYIFPGLSWQGIIIPSINFSILATYIFVSLSLSFTIIVLKWVIKK